MTGASVFHSWKRELLRISSAMSSVMIFIFGAKGYTKSILTCECYNVNIFQVEIRWNERQFILPGHVANKISIGATRNLVIHNCNPKHTEELIRDDLEHIHNLVVFNVTFKGKSCYISTNSVHNAMFARTCMMSRA